MGKFFQKLLAIFSGLLSLFFFLWLCVGIWVLSNIVPESRHYASLIANSPIWPETMAQMTDTLTTGVFDTEMQKIDLPKSGLYSAKYRYRVGEKTCDGSGFEFGQQPTDLIDTTAGDDRVTNFIKMYCSNPEQETREHAVFTNYTCRNFPVHYKPDDVCISYVTKPLNQAGRTAEYRARILNSFNGLSFCFFLFVLFAYSARLLWLHRLQQQPTLSKTE